MLGFIVATVLVILLIFVYSLMRIAHDVDEWAERIYRSRND